FRCRSGREGPPLRPPRGGIARDNPRPAFALRAARTRGGPRSKSVDDAGPSLRLRIGPRRAGSGPALVHCREARSSVRLVQSQLVSDAVDSTSEALPNRLRARAQLGGNLSPLPALLAPFEKRQLLSRESPPRFLQKLSSGDLAARRTLRPGHAL